MQIQTQQPQTSAGCSFESRTVQKAAQKGQLTAADTDQIVRAYQLSGTTDSFEGFAIARDVQKLSGGCPSVAVSAADLAKLQAAIDGPQWF